MKHFLLIPSLLAVLLVCAPTPNATSASLKEYVSSFTYAKRKEMKISSKELVSLLREGKAQLVDIRFPEEFAAWRMGFAVNIPLPELPARLGELDKSKTIVTACPHKDRAIIAMTYLQTQGYRVKYLKDGLLGLAELLRGDRAREFMASR